MVDLSSQTKVVEQLVLYNLMTATRVEFEPDIFDICGY